MAVVAEEARVLVILTDAVFQKIERVGGVLPEGEKRGHVVVDCDVRVLVHRLGHAAQVPALLGVVAEAGVVQRYWRCDHEEVADARVFINAPPGRVAEDEAVVATTCDEVVSVRMLREHERDPAIGINPEDRRERVCGGSVIHPDLVAWFYDRLVAPIEPDARLERIFDQIAVEPGLDLRARDARKREQPEGQSGRNGRVPHETPSGRWSPSP
ncbi:MAG: hypothetical protein OEN56_15750 [Gemmatimonadota bacterium]|nr:hypothetical protein [Gemmatimonadota bacterium]